MSDQDAAVDADDLEYMYLFAVSGRVGHAVALAEEGHRRNPAEMSELLMSMIQHGVGGARLKRARHRATAPRAHCEVASRFC